MSEIEKLIEEFNKLNPEWKIEKIPENFSIDVKNKEEVYKGFLELLKHNHNEGNWFEVLGKDEFPETGNGMGYFYKKEPLMVEDVSFITENMSEWDFREYIYEQLGYNEVHVDITNGNLIVYPVISEPFLLEFPYYGDKENISVFKEYISYLDESVDILIDKINTAVETAEADAAEYENERISEEVFNLITDGRFLEENVLAPYAKEKGSIYNYSEIGVDFIFPFKYYYLTSSENEYLKRALNEEAEEYYTFYINNHDFESWDVKSLLKPKEPLFCFHHDIILDNISDDYLPLSLTLTEQKEVNLFLLTQEYLDGEYDIFIKRKNEFVNYTFNFFIDYRNELIDFLKSLKSGYHNTRVDAKSTYINVFYALKKHIEKNIYNAYSAKEYLVFFKEYAPDLYKELKIRADKEDIKRILMKEKNISGEHLAKLNLIGFFEEFKDILEVKEKIPEPAPGN